MVRVFIDGGQGFLKVIVKVFDKTNKNEMYIESGVKKCFILAIVENVSEDNGNLHKILSRLNLDDVTYHLAFDLKCGLPFIIVGNSAAALDAQTECFISSELCSCAWFISYTTRVGIENTTLNITMNYFRRGLTHSAQLKLIT